MKKKNFWLAALGALVVFGVAATSLNAVSATADAVPSASGHGNYTEADGELRTFSFHARTHADGVTRGSFVVNNRSNGHFLKGKIDCLNIIGNTATVSGTITSSSVEDLVPIGTRARFGVADNGEGDEAPADRMSRFANFSTDSCVESPITNHSLAVDGGNIQVRP